MTNMQDPFDDLQNGNTDDFDAADLASDEELAEADRFAEVLDRMAAGGGVDLDPREDPTLAALTTVAAQLDDNAREATSTPRYASYRSRSREYLLGRIERERAARDAPQPAREEPSRGFGIPFLRLNVLTPIASAAAAAVAMLALVVFNGSGGDPTPVTPETASVVDPPAAQPVAGDGADEQDPVEPVLPVRYVYITLSNEPSAEDLTDQFARATDVRPPAPSTVATTDDAAATEDASQPAPATVAVAPRPAPVPASSGAPSAASTQRATPRTVPEQLDHIETLLGELTVQVQGERPVPGTLLRELTESIAAVAYHIEATPGDVTSTQVVAYINAAAQGRILLAAAVAEEGNDPALNAARRVAQDGVVVASWHIKYHQ